MRIPFPTFLLICCVLAWSPQAAAQTPVSPIHFSDYPACLRTGAEPVEIEFSTDVSGVTDWWWDFGNGQQSTLPRPVASYDAPESYDVTLTLTTGVSGRPGSITVVEEDLIQINRQVIEDDFADSDYSAAIWGDFDSSLIVDRALEFEITFLTPEDQQSGEIICLNGGGEAPALTSGRFYFDLELIAEDPRFVAYSAFRLLDDGLPEPKILADLRVQRVDKRFEIRIEGPNGIVLWHPLVAQNPVLTVGLDWYREAGFGDVTVEVREGSEPAVIQHLPLGSQSGLGTVQLGVIDLDWADVTSAGRIRVDNFRTCEYEHRPDP